MDAEYVIRIILRARDEMAAAFAKARAEIAAFSAQSKVASANLDKLNLGITSLNRRLGSLVNRTNEVREALKALSKGTSDAEGENNALTRAEDRLTAAQRDHQVQTSRLTSAHREYVRAQQDVSRADGAARAEAERRLASIEKQLTVQRALRDETARGVASSRNEVNDLRQLVSAHNDNGAALSRLEGILHRSSSTQNEHAGVIRRVRGEYRNLEGDLSRAGSRVRQTERSAAGFVGTLERWSTALSSTGDNVAKLDNNLRGMIVLAVFAFGQQLITVLASLGGELVSVASSAVMAGGAIGGALAAGAAQAIPVIGVLAAAFNRVKNVFQAVQQSTLAQKAEFGRQGQQATKTASATDQLANAQDSLKSALEGVANAHRAVADAERGLEQARRDRIRQLQDLVDAEQRAELAAKGAALSQQEANAQLRGTIQTGGTLADLRRAALGTQEAALGRREATTTRTRSVQDVALAQRQAPGFDQERQAQQRLADANRQLASAERSVARAQRGIDTARRGAQQANAQTLAAARSLNFMLARLDPAEKQLYNALTRLQANYKKNFRSITDTIIGSFTRTVNSVDKLLSDPRILRSARGLASSLAHSFDRVSNAFLGPGAIGQIVRFANEAKKNLVPVTSIAINLGKTFMNIADAAAPAFHRMLVFIRDLTQQWETFTGDRSKMTDFFNRAEVHFEAWVHLIGSVVRLFAALTGAAESQGLSAIDELTATINRAAGWVTRNRTEVQGFLHDAHEVTKALLGLLWQVVVAMAKAFNPENTIALAKVLEKVVIPALVLTVTVVGHLTTLFAKFFSLPGVSTLASWAVSFLLFAKVATGTVGLFGGMIGQVAHFFGLFKSFTNFLGGGPGAPGGGLVGVLRRVGGAFSALGSTIAKTNIGTAITDGIIGPLRGLWGKVRGLLSTFATSVVARFRIIGVEAGAAEAEGEAGAKWLSSLTGFFSKSWAKFKSIVVKAATALGFEAGAAEAAAEAAGSAGGAAAGGAGGAIRRVVSRKSGRLVGTAGAVGGGAAASALDSSLLFSPAGLAVGGAALTYGATRLVSDQAFGRGGYGLPTDKGGFLSGVARSVPGLSSVAATYSDKQLTDMTNLEKSASHLRDMLKSGDAVGLQKLKGQAAAVWKELDETGRLDPKLAKSLRNIRNDANRAISAIGADRWKRSVNEINAVRFPDVSGFVRQLDHRMSGLPQTAREQMAKTMIETARTMEREGRAPKGTTDRLISYIEHKYAGLVPALKQSGHDSVAAVDATFKDKRIIRTVDGQIAALRRTWGFMPKYAQTTSGNAKEQWRAAMDYLEKKMATSTGKQYQVAYAQWKKLRSMSGDVTDVVRGHWRRSLDYILNKTAIVLPNMLSLFGTWGSALASVLNPIGKAFKFVSDQIDKMGGVSDKNIGKFINRLNTAGKNAGRRFGGPIAGYGGGDIVSAALEPGEHVWTKEEVRAAGGHGVIHALRQFFGGGGQSIGFGFAQGGAVGRRAPNKKADAGDAGDLLGQIEGILSDTSDKAIDIWNKMWKKIANITDNNADKVQKRVRQLRNAMNDSFDKMVSDSRSMDRGVTSALNSLAGAVYDGMSYVSTATDRALKAYDVKPVKLNVPKPKGIGKAVGGWIGYAGERGKDLVNTWLGRGELVLNWAQQQAVNARMSGQETLQSIVQRTRGFHAGGPETELGYARGGIVPIPGMPGEGIYAPLVPAIRFLIKKFKLLVTDGYAAHGHAANSDHHWGGAVDLVPGRGGSWDLVDRLAKLAEPSQNHPVNPPFRWVGYDGDAGHGRGNHLHLSWNRGGPYNLPGSIAHGDLGAIGGDVPKIIVKGTAGALRDLAQKAINRVRRAAQDKIDASMPDVSGQAGLAGSIADLSGMVGNNARKMWDYFRGTGRMTQEGAAAMIGNFVQESGLDPNSQQAGGPGMGIAQWSRGARWDQLVRWARERHGNPKSLATQLGFVMAELSSSYRNVLRALRTSHNLPQLVSLVAHGYEAAGIIGDRLTPARGVLSRLGRGFKHGGEIDGPEGTPTGVLAHAGEWILNRFQQSRLARLMGMSTDGLRSLLGFHGSAAKGYQGGGPVATGGTVQPRIQGGRIDLSDLLHPGILPLGFDALIKTARGVFLGLSRLNKKTKSYFDKFENALDLITGDNGILAQLETARQNAVNRLTRNLTFAQYRVGRGGQVTQRLSNPQVANRQLSNARSALTDIVDEESVITKAQRDAAKGLKEARRKHDKDAVRAFQQQQIRLSNSLNTLRDAHAQAIEAVFQAQNAAAQAAIDKVNNDAAAQTGNLDIATRVANAFGNTGWLKGINDQRVKVLGDQANQLEATLAKQSKNMTPDQIQAVQSQIADLRTQVIEATQQMISDSADVINQNAQRKLTRLDLFGRMADAMGAVGLGGPVSPAANLSGLGALGQQAAALFASSTGQVSVAGQSMNRSSIFAQRQATLTDQRNQLADLLRSVQANPATSQNTKAISDLSDQIAELDVTIKENARAAFQAQVDAVNNASNYALGINDLNKQIITLNGSINGTIDQQALLANATERQTLLTQQGNALQALLTTAIADGDVAATQDLTTQLLQNQVAVLENTQSINELNGTMTEPQTFTSTAWSWFRDAVFTGMGGVLPQYQIPMMQTGGIAQRAGLYHLEPGEVATPEQHWNKLVEAVGSARPDHFDITVNGVDGEPDYEYMASTVARKKAVAKATG